MRVYESRGAESCCPRKTERPAAHASAEYSVTDSRDAGARDEHEIIEIFLKRKGPASLQAPHAPIHER
jgi:hypothetical protein